MCVRALSYVRTCFRLTFKFVVLNYSLKQQLVKRQIANSTEYTTEKLPARSSTLKEKREYLQRGNV